MIAQCILSVISDVTMVISTILLISSLGISRINKKRKLSVIVLISFLLAIVICISYPLKINYISLFIYPIMFLFAFKIAFGKVSSAQIYVALIAELICTLLSACGALFVFQFTALSYDLSGKIVLGILRLIYLGCAIYYLKSGKLESIQCALEIIPKRFFIFVIIVLICIDTLSIFNNYPQVSILKQNIVTGLIIIVTITLLIMIFSLLINVASNNYYTALNTLLEKQVSAQIAHYEKLEKLNSDMRTFRHDYINHLSSINALIGEGCYDDAQNYIDKLTESTHRNEAIFRTGNRLADAILTDKSESCRDHADIEFDGCITDKIGNSDICIILANALDNAVEACKKCPERGKITVAAQIRQGYWTMTMRNPTVSADSEGIMKTSKEDERNHGFGLLSIEQTVKKYDGTMAVSIKDGMFEMSVVLKIPEQK